MPRQQKTLVVGWLSADWHIVIPLVDAGKLPNLGRLIDRGVIGKLTGVEPSAAPAAWTSIATGKRPCRHGILSEHEAPSLSAPIRPVTCLGRRTQALWNMVGQRGYRCRVAAWPASHPAEPLPDAVIVSDYFLGGLAPGAAWPLPHGAIHPADRAGELAALRVHPSEIGTQDLLPFVPRLTEAIDAHDARLPLLAAILAETTGIHAVFTEMLASEPWDFAAVVFPGLDRLSRTFMSCHPPKPDFVSEGDFERFQNVVEMGYIFHDMMLGSLLELAGGDATVMVLSDQGFPSGSNRVPPRDGDASAPPERHEVGLLVFSGPGIRQDTLLFGSSILDIAPTLLHNCGLPVGRDMDGRVLLEAFEAPSAVETIESWDGIETGAGLHPPARRFDPLEVLRGFARSPGRDMTERRLRGGPGDVDEDGQEWREEVFADLAYRLAESLLEAHREGEAADLLEALWASDPAESRHAYSLMHCYLALGRTDLAEHCLNRFVQNKKRYAPAAQRAWRALAARDSSSLRPIERARMNRLYKQSRTNLSGTAYMRAWLLRAAGRLDEALTAASAADEMKVYSRTGLLRLKGECLLELERWADARLEYEKLIGLDPDDADGHLGLARILFAEQRYAEAAASAEASFALRYYNPRAHYLYGASIFRCGRPAAAAAALKIATEQGPHLVGAWQRLAMIYGGPLDDRELAARYAAKAAEAEKANEARAAQRRQATERDPMF